MARGALLRGVHSDQREPGGRVVECGAEPVHGRVAAGAILREIRGFVRRIVGPVVIRLVTVPASAIRQTVVVIDVALRALQAGMRAGQREAGIGVVEGSAGPIRNGVAVAESAILREPGSCVRRVVSAGIIRLVAIPAIGAAQRIIVVYMARRALLSSVNPHESESRRRVAEPRPQPLYGCVTQRAVLRECRRFMWRAVRRVEIVQMAVDAGPARKTVIAIDVTLGALQAGVCSGEREASGGMIELGAEPLHGVMATGAILREIRRLMVRIVRGIVVIQMASDTGTAR